MFLCASASQWLQSQVSQVPGRVSEDLEKKGVTILRPPRDGYMAFVKSPDGISIELLQKGQPLPLKEPWKSQASTGSW